MESYILKTPCAPSEDLCLTPSFSLIAIRSAYTTHCSLYIYFFYFLFCYFSPSFGISSGLTSLYIHWLLYGTAYPFFFIFCLCCFLCESPIHFLFLLLLSIFLLSMISIWIFMHIRHDRSVRVAPDNRRALRRTEQPAGLNALLKRRRWRKQRSAKRKTQTTTKQTMTLQRVSVCA